MHWSDVSGLQLDAHSHWWCNFICIYILEFCEEKNLKRTQQLKDDANWLRSEHTKWILLDFQQTSIQDSCEFNPKQRELKDRIILLLYIFTELNLWIRNIQHNWALLNIVFWKIKYSKLFCLILDGYVRDVVGLGFLVPMGLPPIREESAQLSWPFLKIVRV